MELLIYSFMELFIHLRNYSSIHRFICVAGELQGLRNQGFSKAVKGVHQARKASCEQSFYTQVLHATNLTIGEYHNDWPASCTQQLYKGLQPTAYMYEHRLRLTLPSWKSLLNTIHWLIHVSFHGSVHPWIYLVLQSWNYLFIYLPVYSWSY